MIAPMLSNMPPIQDDLACLKCGYNLRGLSPESPCPECEWPIAKSMRAGDTLDFDQIRRLRDALILVLCGSIPCGLALATYAYASIYADRSPSIHLITNAALLTHSPFAAIRCAGMFAFTHPLALPRPFTHVADPRKFTRLLAVVLVIAGAMAGFCNYLITVVLQVSDPLRGWAACLQVVAIFVLALGSMLSGVAVLSLAETIANRIGDHKLSIQLNYSARWMPAIGLYGLLAYLLGPLVVWMMYIRLLGLLLRALMMRCIAS